MRTPEERSPFGLIQEDLRQKPWAILVSCIMLTKASGNVVRPILKKFLERWPTPESYVYEMIGSEDCGESTRQEMVDMLKPLGFQNLREKRIFGMTCDFVGKKVAENPEKIVDVYGVGKYAEDSFRIFYMAHLVQDVQDKELRRFIEWASRKTAATHD